MGANDDETTGGGMDDMQTSLEQGCLEFERWAYARERRDAALFERAHANVAGDISEHVRGFDEDNPWREEYLESVLEDARALREADVEEDERHLSFAELNETRHTLKEDRRGDIYDDAAAAAARTETPDDDAWVARRLPSQVDAAADDPADIMEDFVTEYVPGRKSLRRYLRGL